MNCVLLIINKTIEEKKMAWKRVVRLVRPNNSVDFENFTDSENQHITDNYVTSGKCISFNVVVRPKCLERFNNHIFENKSNRNECVSE